MISQDPRPTKAQFAAMPHQQRALHTRPLAPDGQPYPTMTGSELKAFRETLGLSERALAIKLKIRGKTPETSIIRWEKGDTKKYGHKAIVPGSVAYKVLAMGAK